MERNDARRGGGVKGRRRSQVKGTNTPGCSFACFASNLSSWQQDIFGQASLHQEAAHGTSLVCTDQIFYTDSDALCISWMGGVDRLLAKEPTTR